MSDTVPQASDPVRKAFEAWYAVNAFDYVTNPIGSRECGLQWKSWQAAIASQPDRSSDEQFSDGWNAAEKHYAKLAKLPREGGPCDVCSSRARPCLCPPALAAQAQPIPAAEPASPDSLGHPVEAA